MKPIVFLCKWGIGKVEIIGLYAHVRKFRFTAGGSFFFPARRSEVVFVLFAAPIVIRVTKMVILVNAIKIYRMR